MASISRLYAQGGDGVYTLLSQVFNANAGDTRSLDVFFFATDDAYLELSELEKINDNGYVVIKEVGGDPGVIVASLFDMDVLTVGGFGATDWTPGWYTFLSSGNYYLEIGVANIGDNTAPELTSVIGVDNVRLTPVPEPAPLVGGGLVGLLGLGLHWRRHRRHATA